MRFMMIVKATADSEAGVMPSQELINAMQKYNEELVKAGVLLTADGLQPSSSGLRISYPEPGGKPKLVDGPFTEAKEIIAGYTLIEVKSREEAIEWALRMPDPHGFGQGEIELRQVFEMEDIMVNPQTLAKEVELRKQVEEQKKA
ncbi:YciI family protein [Paenibacillus radicis (ex Xue et al. 2023)]|uniref:YciI family protein n=1 Tax=Paenibacillus radicis (ex Xue et al. 2023) TaxID=2972489 RepID=A0ABT1YUW3_9BACL|nr:YciI family protein [Paenibacillus radicis (ex Xue et al. 2023)]MCR8636645.1 YciI family protein [Paenibacillus radicis (ex Xue et al. 2023)]